MTETPDAERGGFLKGPRIALAALAVSVVALGGPGQSGLRVADDPHLGRVAETQTGGVERPGRLDRRPDLHLDPSLTRQTPADDLPPQAPDRLTVVGTGALEHPRQHRLFAVGPQFHMGPVGGVLRRVLLVEQGRSDRIFAHRTNAMRE